MANRIAEMLGGGEPRVWDGAAGRWRAVQPGDIAILVPRLQDTTSYEDALSEAGVDYYVVAGAGLFVQQEVFDVINALRAIDNPLDDVALMGFLRGGMVGLDDNSLLHVAIALDPPFRPVLRDGRLADRLAPPAHRRLLWSADLLASLAADKDAYAIDALLERLLAETAFPAALLGQYHGRRKCGNVYRLVEHARSAQAAGACLREFIDFLTELTVEQVRAEQAATEAEGGQVVRIMTIHKAKGLEFPVVFLPDLNYAPRSHFGRLGRRGPWGLTLRVDPGDGEDGRDGQSWTMAKDLDRRKERAEDIRKLYVAVTRHRDQIVFVGALQQSSDGGLGKTGSALRLLDDALDLGQALSAGWVELGDGARAVVRRVVPPGLRPGASSSVLDEMIAGCDSPESLADALAAPSGPATSDAFPHLAPVAPRGVERVAPTALAALEFCPALFHWHYELRVPAAVLTGGQDLSNDIGRTGQAGAGALDAATAGTVFHRCMELLDFDDPQPAGALMHRALEEQGVSVDPAAMTAELEQMLQGIRRHRLWATLTGTRQRLRELEFVTRIGRLEVQGVIDLLIQSADGQWLVIDYKSDRVAPADVAAHARRYHLQMLLYADAAHRLLAADSPGREPWAGGIPATLYFLRPGLAHTFAAETLTSGLADRLAGLADRLACCRREGAWPGRRDGACGHCHYAALCGRAP